jgi:hypothetical protein
MYSNTSAPPNDENVNAFIISRSFQYDGLALRKELIYVALSVNKKLAF